ncbi:unnamed protein product [Bursaphelenchus okinawaensis]|uniref:Uncharacterized protein n=1 Tax=Bursaphelenchus okinawaensis TaxID=465554 RepID=A0A811LRZ7_9BILA|nr:unnamed protein product [Bursaphelenchus okinawaensis]CAG9127305.1 unnamed protein product [Bursaphelenchus okinawaensis]
MSKYNETVPEFYNLITDYQQHKFPPKALKLVNEINLAREDDIKNEPKKVEELSQKAQDFYKEFVALRNMKELSFRKYMEKVWSLFDSASDSVARATES